MIRIRASRRYITDRTTYTDIIYDRTLNNSYGAANTITCNSVERSIFFIMERITTIGKIPEDVSKVNKKRMQHISLLKKSYFFQNENDIEDSIIQDTIKDITKMNRRLYMFYYAPYILESKFTIEITKNRKTFFLLDFFVILQFNRNYREKEFEIHHSIADKALIYEKKAIEKYVRRNHKDYITKDIYQDTIPYIFRRFNSSFLLVYHTLESLTKENKIVLKNDIYFHEEGLLYKDYIKLTEWIFNTLMVYTRFHDSADSTKISFLLKPFPYLSVYPEKRQLSSLASLMPIDS